MKFFIAILALSLFVDARAQTRVPAATQNIFIITTDGFRWQEVFTGADSLLINDPLSVRDTALMKQIYWDSSVLVRRQKLMPFFWNVIAARGQLYGNRFFGNKVDVRNIYKISYAGYNEILTGYTDPVLIPNIPLNNPNMNILRYLDGEQEYQGKVAAFGSWNILPYIFNRKRSKFHINSGYQRPDDQDSADQAIDRVQEQVVHKEHTRYDQLTYLSAREYIGRHHPRIVFIGLGETDESAHAGRYDLYLQHAADFDRMIGELWYGVQTDPFYRDNTTFIITTDHGRGASQASWHNHGILTKGSGETWLAMLGPGIVPLGELHTPAQTYQKQVAATIALLLGEKFETSHPVATGIALPVPGETAILNKIR